MKVCLYIGNMFPCFCFVFTSHSNIKHRPVRNSKRVTTPKGNHNKRNLSLNPKTARLTRSTTAHVLRKCPKIYPTLSVYVTKVKVIQGHHICISFICTKFGKVTLFFTHNRRFAPCSICLNWCLFTLLGAGVGVGAGTTTGKGTTTIGDNGSWLLPLSQTSVNISA